MKLDPNGYMTLTLDDRDDVAAWLADNGFILTETVSYELLDDGAVVVTSVAHDTHGKTYIDPTTNRFATRVTSIHPTTPPRWFNPHREHA